jgi:hypothetical protein
LRRFASIAHALPVRARAAALSVALAAASLLAPSRAGASGLEVGGLEVGGPEVEAPELQAAPARPPRISGTYLGMSIWPGMSWAFSPNLDVDQSRVIPGGGGAIHLGQAVFPWMTLGLDASGGFFFNRDTFFMEGGLLVELGFYPVPRYPFSLRTGFGFGAGLILDDRVEERGGVGGPRFMGGVRYEFFPGAERKRPHRAGGWAVGPELTWRGFTPAAKGRPMSNTVLLGIWFGFYWGE